MSHKRFDGIGLHVGQGDAEMVGDDLLGDKEKVEEPQTKRQFQRQQVSQANHGEREPQPERGRRAPRSLGKVRVQRNQVNVERRNHGNVVVQSIDGVNGKRQREEQPHHAVAEERRQRMTVFVSRHVNRQVNERKHEFFVVHPRLAQNCAEAEEDEINAQHERAPRQQRHHPLAPRNRLARRQTVVKPHNRLAFLRREPLGNVRLNRFRPTIFGSGEVKRTGDVGNQQPRQPERRNSSGDEHHAINQQ